jgi:hypothetical protein
VENLGYTVSGKTNDFSAVTTTISANYVYIVPNSHYWTNLEMLLTQLGYTLSSGNQWYENAWKAEVQYLIVGLKNTIKNGYQIKKLKKSNEFIPERLEDMISFIEEVDFSGDYQPNQFLNDLIISIENMIQSGYNLKNGKKRSLQNH